MVTAVLRSSAVVALVAEAAAGGGVADEQRAVLLGRPAQKGVRDLDRRQMMMR